MRKIALILFFIIAVGELLAIAAEVAWLHHLCKPLIMITLGLYYVTESKWREQAISLSVLGGILFSSAGDALLMYQEGDPSYFMFGLVAFLLAHIFYILAYRQHRHAEATYELAGIHKIRMAFPFLLAGTGLVVVLYPTLHSLKVPVIIYAAALVTMVLAALFRYGRTTRDSFMMVFGGAVLFMISDSLLAINKFLTPIENESLWIMVTYMSAQYLIVRGLTRHV
ncbi:MAG: lysoplasmalogenase [Flammeovirgaceae bacterium]|nr:lysoplasmalogenase [Flammeovirgaceae bacterium]